MPGIQFLFSSEHSVSARSIQFQFSSARFGGIQFGSRVFSSKYLKISSIQLKILVRVEYHYSSSTKWMIHHGRSFGDERTTRSRTFVRGVRAHSKDVRKSGRLCNKRTNAWIELSGVEAWVLVLNLICTSQRFGARGPSRRFNRSCQIWSKWCRCSFSCSQVRDAVWCKWCGRLTSQTGPLLPTSQILCNEAP
jgi:hypothetical protein